MNLRSVWGASGGLLLAAAVAMAGCSHGAGAFVPATTAGTVSSGVAHGGMHTADASTGDSCPTGSALDGDGNCDAIIATVNSNCDEQCQEDANPCVQDPSMCPGAPPPCVIQCANGGGGGDGDPTQLAEYQGPPTQGQDCKQSDTAPSMDVGDTLGQVDKVIKGEDVQSIRSVADINQIDTDNGSNGSTSDMTLAGISYYPVGWLYLDQDGGLWFQKDPNTEMTASISATLDGVLGVGVSFPNVSSSVIS